MAKFKTCLWTKRKKPKKNLLHRMNSCEESFHVSAFQNIKSTLSVPATWPAPEPSRSHRERRMSSYWKQPGSEEATSRAVRCVEATRSAIASSQSLSQLACLCPTSSVWRAVTMLSGPCIIHTRLTTLSAELNLTWGSTPSHSSSVMMHFERPYGRAQKQKSKNCSTP